MTAKWIGRISVLVLPVVSLVGFSFATPQATTATSRLTAARVAAPAMIEVRFSPTSPRDEDLRLTKQLLRERSESIQALNLAILLYAIRDNAVRENAARTVSWHPQSFYGGPVAQVSISQVMACIAGAESGNYSESSHPGSGSGAYQFIPGTWRTWFGKWKAATGYPGYFSLAYQAPGSVQDAVLDYTLRNGGAGNWSPKYGKDSCTVGMGG